MHTEPGAAARAVQPPRECWIGNQPVFQQPSRNFRNVIEFRQCRNAHVSALRLLPEMRVFRLDGCSNRWLPSPNPPKFALNGGISLTMLRSSASSTTRQSRCAETDQHRGTAGQTCDNRANRGGSNLSNSASSGRSVSRRLGYWTLSPGNDKVDYRAGAFATRSGRGIKAGSGHIDVPTKLKFFGPGKSDESTRIHSASRFKLLSAAPGGRLSEAIAYRQIVAQRAMPMPFTSGDRAFRSLVARLKRLKHLHRDFADPNAPDFRANLARRLPRSSRLTRLQGNFARRWR